MRIPVYEDHKWEDEESVWYEDGEEDAAYCLFPAHKN
jgi:general stress protein 26